MSCPPGPEVHRELLERYARGRPLSSVPDDGYILQVRPRHRHTRRPWQFSRLRQSMHRVQFIASHLCRRVIDQSRIDRACLWICLAA